MIDNKTIINRVAKELSISKLQASKVISKTFREIENTLLEDNSFMFKGYTKIVKSKGTQKRMNKTDLLKIETKEK